MKNCKNCISKAPLHIQNYSQILDIGEISFLNFLMEEPFAKLQNIAFSKALLEIQNGINILDVLENCKKTSYADLHRQKLQ